MLHRAVVAKHQNHHLGSLRRGHRIDKAAVVLAVDVATVNKRGVPTDVPSLNRLTYRDHARACAIRPAALFVGAPGVVRHKVLVVRHRSDDGHATACPKRESQRWLVLQEHHPLVRRLSNHLLGVRRVDVVNPERGPPDVGEWVEAPRKEELPKSPPRRPPDRGLRHQTQLRSVHKVLRPNRRAHFNIGSVVYRPSRSVLGSRGMGRCAKHIVYRATIGGDEGVRLLEALAHHVVQQVVVGTRRAAVLSIVGAHHSRSIAIPERNLVLRQIAVPVIVHRDLVIVVPAIGFGRIRGEVLQVGQHFGVASDVLLLHPPQH
mmetsp:Transcript_31094/g.81467  ORF Transcript_31094/g.81467 Transcript_31094/m.81467 type:complete len:318 (+) Transcript_31094:863-1816(+)